MKVRSAVNKATRCSLGYGQNYPKLSLSPVKPEIPNVLSTVKPALLNVPSAVNLKLFNVPTIPLL